MKLAELSVRRHVLAFMASAVFVLFGLVAYQRIGVDRFRASSSRSSPSRPCCRRQP